MKYSDPASTGADENDRACLSPAAADVSFRQPSPFRPPDANDSEQLSFAAHPDVFGSTISAV
ncbi:hypothetical protein KBZ21_53880, partial [Streptomyces sp. A73]|nr:hypothetical protein [Streptomyces sp. A73]